MIDVREQKREAVIQAAIALMSSTDPALNRVMHPLEIALDDTVSAYEAFLRGSEFTTLPSQTPEPLRTSDPA